MKDGKSIRWLKFDVVTRTGKRIDLLGSDPQDLSLDGMAFPRASGLALLPGELVVHEIVNRKGKLIPKYLIQALDRWSGRLGHPTRSR